MKITHIEGVGVVRYIGKLRHPSEPSGVVYKVSSSRIWIGVEFDVPCGTSDGSKDGQRYFTCAHNHAVFLRASSSMLVGVS